MDLELKLPPSISSSKMDPIAWDAWSNFLACSQQNLQLLSVYYFFNSDHSRRRIGNEFIVGFYAEDGFTRSFPLFFQLRLETWLCECLPWIWSTAVSNCFWDCLWLYLVNYNFVSDLFRFGKEPFLLHHFFCDQQAYFCSFSFIAFPSIYFLGLTIW